MACTKRVYVVCWKTTSLSAMHWRQQGTVAVHGGPTGGITASNLAGETQMIPPLSPAVTRAQAHLPAAPDTLGAAGSHVEAEGQLTESVTMQGASSYSG